MREADALLGQLADLLILKVCGLVLLAIAGAWLAREGTLERLDGEAHAAVWRGISKLTKEEGR